jgi:hypothetical protein
VSPHADSYRIRIDRRSCRTRALNLMRDVFCFPEQYVELMASIAPRGFGYAKRPFKDPQKLKSEYIFPIDLFVFCR